MKFTNFSFIVLFVLCCAFLIPGAVSAAPEFNPDNGHYYELIPFQGITWEQANTAAQASIYNGVNGHLATITSSEENAFIVAKYGAVLEGVNYFLGGFQPVGSVEPDGSWQWVTGEAWDYTHWAVDAGAPNDAYGGDEGPSRFGNHENGLEIYYADGSWNDYPLDCPRNGYIVEYEPMTAPEFPSTILPATMIIGFMGAVLLIQRTREK